MKKYFLAPLLFVFSVSTASVSSAAELQEFLKNCAYGTLAGAAVGVMSLALSDKPSEHGSNIAKGASLGLYAGIIYGVVKLNQPLRSTNPDPYARLTPHFDSEQHIDGAKLSIDIARF